MRTARAIRYAVAAIAGAALLIATGGVGAGMSSTTEVGSARNGLIVFVGSTSDDSGYASDIYVTDAFGRTPKRLTDNGAGKLSPAWSWDARRIAFVRDWTTDADRSLRRRISVMNADGTGARNISGTHASDSQPVWSPNGRKIAFVESGVGHSDEIWVMNADGSKRRPLRTAAGNRVPPLWGASWSSNSSEIIFMGDDPDRELDEDYGYGIWAVNVESGATRSLLANAFLRTLRPGSGADLVRLSPDHKRILFKPRGDRYGRLFVARVDGTRKVPVAGVWALYATWSPDSRRIVYLSTTNRGEYQGLEVVNADGTGRRKITPDLPGASYPSWGRARG